MNVDDIRTVLIVGAGTMGQQISLQCAMHGYDVIAYDVSQRALETAAEGTRSYAEQLVARERLTREEADAALGRIRFTANAQDGAEADLLNESLPEDPELKARVFAQFNDICPPRTIFTTNTSTLLPSTFAQATGRPEQFAALHFHQFVWDANLADVMPHPGTSPQIVALLTEFAKRIGQVPLVLKKEHAEYVVNAILAAMNSTAIRLYTEGVASIEAIDRAVMIVLGLPAGPFGSQDVVGLDTVWHIAQNKARASGDAQEQAFADLLKREYIDKGRLGVKSGRGYYTYPNPAYAEPGFLSGEAQPGEA